MEAGSTCDGGQNERRVILALNYVIKHYVMNAYGGVEA
jgi:hypothetical protein